MKNTTEYTDSPLIEMALALCKRIIMKDKLKKQVFSDLADKVFLDWIRTGSPLVLPTEAEVKTEYVKRLAALNAEEPFNLDDIQIIRGVCAPLLLLHKRIKQ